ncbi:extracellular matrix protein 2 [Chanos chanos]|uniref:Extracellular matrix protein 2 n=1 Tax=Chanos chanos TaxID=29144 RepID=A0A6J2VK21_CHACN|nr:extracellular matrix protein 2 [Chanos chanos]
MKLKIILAVSLFVFLSLSLAQDQRNPLARGNRRRANQKRGRKLNSRVSAQRDRLPVNDGDDGGTIFIDSYKSIDEKEPKYNVIPGKTGQCVFRGITMFEKAVWSPKPCVTCLCSNGAVICDEITCPALRCHLTFTPTGECCPVCMDSVLDAPELSGDFPEPDDPVELDPARPRTQEEIDDILRKEEEEHRREEEHLRKKDAERKRRKKKKKEEERLRKILEEQERKEALRKKELERQKEEERRRLREEAEELAAAEEKKRREYEQKRAEEERLRMLEMEQRELLRALEEAAERADEGGRNVEDDEEEEEIVWLRGDVFQMPPPEPTPVELPPFLESSESNEEEPERVTYSLPKGCTISDVIVSCENAKLTSIPPLSIPELKSLSLEGNEITTIPAGAFNGVPNLEWIEFGKNKISSSGIDPQAFKNLKFLKRLYMDGNPLEQIPSDLPPTLEELKINENNLRGIDENSFQGLSHLLTLEMEGNLLSEGNVDPQAFAPLKELNYLRLGRNHFRTVPQGLPMSLLELHLENNLIEEIPETAFNNTKNLNVIVLRHNKIEESRIAPLTWINHRNLESIDLSHNKLYLVPSFLPKSLVHLVLVGNQIERIPGYVFAHMEPGLEYLYLSYNKLDGDGTEPESFFGTLNTMTELCLDHNQLITVPAGINEMTSLHFLRLNNNKIRHIATDAICDPLNDEDSHLVAVRLENNFIDPRKIPPTAFSCVRSYSSVVLKPQRIK